MSAVFQKVRIASISFWILLFWCVSTAGASEGGPAWYRVLDNAPFHPFQDGSSLVFEEKLWLIGEHGVYNSSGPINALSFSLIATPEFAPNHASIVYYNKMWVLGGGWARGSELYELFLKVLWYSVDGTQWFRQVPPYYPWSPRVGPSAVNFKGFMWLMGGLDASIDCCDGEKETVDFEFVDISLGKSEPRCISYSDIWRSTNGENWVEGWVPWKGRGFHQTLVFKNRIWVIGGRNLGDIEGSWECAPWFVQYFNDVWSSLDGENWVQETEAAPWAPRSLHAAVVYDDKIWVMGGYSPDAGYFSDVWYSSDGINWIQEAEAAPWGPRAGHTAVVYQDHLLVIGGESKTATYGDVWAYCPIIAAEGEGEGYTPEIHSADWNEGPDNRIDLAELLRVIQFYNSGGYCCASLCDPLSDEGFLPGDGDRTCAPHAADYNPRDWRINLSEVLRIIQFYNSSGYRACEDGEDGFCPGK